MKGTKFVIYLFIISLCFSSLIIGFIHIAQAKEFIWRIGNPDNEYEEFSWPETEIIDYLVPSNWGEILTEDNPDWGGFPRHLCTYYGNEHDEEKKGLREISINFPYSYCQEIGFFTREYKSNHGMKSKEIFELSYKIMKLLSPIVL